MPTKRKPKSPRARRNARKRRIKKLKRYLLIAGAFALVAMLINWWWVGRETREAQPFAGGHVVQVTGPDLNVREFGSGSLDGAVVLLSGYTTSIEFWDAVAPALATGHRVVAIDPVGHGGSESPGNAGAFEADGQSRSVARVIRALGMNHVSVVGQSMGGAIAVRLAETEPVLISKVALVDTWSAPGETQMTALRDVACLPLLGPALDHFRGIRALSRGGLADSVAPGTDVPDFAYRSLERLTWKAFCNSRATGELNEDMPIAERLVDTGKPALVVYGGKDVLTPTAGNVAAYRAAGIDVQVIAGSGHSPHVETPAELVNILRTFVN